MKLKFALMMAGLGLVQGTMAISVTDVTARQRWPWNNLVDIDFTLVGDGKPGERFQVGAEAVQSETGKKLYAKTFISDPIVEPGQNRLVWDFGRDYPNLKANDLLFSVTVREADYENQPQYMVIDFSGGKNATTWPVRYTSVPPVHTPKNTNDVCKLTEMWFRRVHPKGEPFNHRASTAPSSDNNYFYSRLTRDYYIGIFPVTQRQWYQITGNWLSYCSNPLWRDTRPVDMFYSNLLYGNYTTFIDTGSGTSSSVLEKLRTRTGLPTLAVPTEAQWVYALHNGPMTTNIDTYKDKDGNVIPADECMRHSGNSGDKTAYADATAAALCDLDTGSAAVGCYKPNVLGLYDMLGNVYEEMVDPYVTTAELKNYYTTNNVAFPVENPTGGNSTLAKIKCGNNVRPYIHKGGYQNSASDSKTWSFYEWGYASYIWDNKVRARGVRLCVTVE